MHTVENLETESQHFASSENAIITKKICVSSHHVWTPFGVGFEDVSTLVVRVVHAAWKFLEPSVEIGENWEWLDADRRIIQTLSIARASKRRQ